MPSNSYAAATQKIKHLEIKALESEIPGFFPSPPELIERLLELADLRPEEHQVVLEPSAGKGDILEAIGKYHDQFGDLTLHAIEINPLLREILEAKNYDVVARDFLEYNPGQIYDRIIMNPPFEKFQDVDHVSHAFGLLKPGGKLAAIVSEGPFFRKFKKDEMFRSFLADNDAYISEPIQGAFY